MRIESCLTGPADEEYDGGCSTVFRGEYRGYAVAIKTIRLYLTSDLEKCFNVRTSRRYSGAYVLTLGFIEIS